MSDIVNKTVVGDDDWSTNIPTKPGNYWFYGNPYMGQMGIDYREDRPPVEAEMILCEIVQGGNCLMISGQGQIWPNNTFNRDALRSGVLGYWKKASLPSPPVDTENLFASPGSIEET